MLRNSFIYSHTLRSVGAVPTDVNDVENAQREGVLVMPFFIQDSLCLNIGHSSTSSNDGIDKMATSQTLLQCEKTCEKAFSPTKGIVALSVGLDGTASVMPFMGSDSSSYHYSGCFLHLGAVATQR